MLVVVLLLGTAGTCEGDNGEPLTTGPVTAQNGKEICRDANTAQQMATKLENDLRGADPSQADSLLEDAKALDTELSAELAHSLHTQAVAKDLQDAIHGMQQVENELLKGKVDQASRNADTLLRDAMIQLGMDCSKYLT